MNASPNKFFLYVRKSTDESDRQVLSIQAQLFEVQEYAKREGLTIVRTFEESRTAKAPGRPQFNLMLAGIEQGHANGVIAWHPDRLARNSVDGGRIVYLVDTGKIQDLRFPTFHFEPTAHGKFMLNIAFSQSKYYIDNLSENIKRGLRQKLRNGVWPNRPPVGYVNDRASNTIAVDPTKSRLVRKTFELYATGDYTLRELRAKMNGFGLLSCTDRQMGVNEYHRLLRNTFYYGVMDFGGEHYEGRHDPIISKRLFDAVQEVMKRKSKPKESGLKPYLYRGVFRCGECGCFITTETQKGHNYLRCTKRVSPCKQKYVREDALELQIDRVIARVALEARLAQRMIRELEHQRQGFVVELATLVARLEQELAACNKQVDLLLDLRLAEHISEAEYIAKKQELVSRKAELKGKIEALRRDQNDRFEPVIRFVLEAKYATFLMSTGHREEKRDFLKKIGSNLTVAEKTLSLQFKKPWIFLVDFNSSSNPNHARQRESSKKSEWRCLLDKVRTFYAENPVS